MRQRTRSFGHNATTDSPSLGRWSTRRILCPISNRPMLNLDQETVATRRMYGIDRDLTDRYGRKCLLARRLVEQGVRFVQFSRDG